MALSLKWVLSIKVQSQKSEYTMLFARTLGEDDVSVHGAELKPSAPQFKFRANYVNARCSSLGHWAKMMWLFMALSSNRVLPNSNSEPNM